MTQWFYMQQSLKRRNVYNHCNKKVIKHLNTDQFFYDTHSYHIRMLIIIKYSLVYYVILYYILPIRHLANFANFSKILPPAVSALSLNFAMPSCIFEATTLSSLLVSPTASVTGVGSGISPEGTDQMTCSKGAASCRVGTA